MSTQLQVDRERLAAFCRRHRITKLAFFGSVLTGEFRPDSDVDVLVSFEPGHSPGFIRLHQIEQELSSLLKGRQVDITTYQALNPRIRKQVLAVAETQYAQG